MLHSTQLDATFSWKTFLSSKVILLAITVIILHIFSVIISVNLILVSYLVSTPPSEGLFVRYLTMKSKEDLDFCNVIESPKSNWDDIYKSLNQKKLWDY